MLGIVTDLCQGSFVVNILLEVMPNAGIMYVEGFADDEPAFAALIQMDLVSVVETDEGRGRTGFLFSPQVSLHFDIFTASLNLLHLFFHLYSMFCPAHCLRFTVFLLTSFHIPIPQPFHIPLSMSEVVYFCG